MELTASTGGLALLAEVKRNGSQAKVLSPCLWTQDSDIKSYSESAVKNTNSCPSRVDLCRLSLRKMVFLLRLSVSQHEMRQGFKPSHHTVQGLWT